MKENDNNTGEPLIDKESKQANVEVLDNPKDSKEKPIDQLEIGKNEDESDEESNKLLQDKITLKKITDSEPSPPEEFEGIDCPVNERYTYDPYLESNIINKFIFYWAFNILRMAKKYRLKTTDLGTPAPNNNARVFSKN